jgi:thiol-disulfide isomerase/thioredoxin
MKLSTLLAPLSLGLLAAPSAALAAEETALDARGWHARQAPLDGQALLQPNQAQPITLPPQVADRIERRTVLLYISPTCPHCVAVVPELGALSERIAEHSDFLAIFSGYARRGDVETVAAEWRLPYPWVYDTDKAFALATGLSSTPSVLVVEPGEEPGTVLVGDAYMPYIHGADAILEMRLLGASEPVLGRGDHLGPVTCGACHVEEARSHAMTLHSVAYYHMIEAGGVDTPACLACHVTHPVPAWQPGQPYEGGFQPGDHRSPWADVGCEACHTASGPHDGQGGDPRAVCTTCHAVDHVPFDAQRGLALIDHFAGNHVTDEELSAWRAGVATGEVERPLATMPRGPSAGVQACAPCHKPQARQWRKTPHAHAMDHLEGEDADNVGCVVCHATPVDSSQRVDDATGFRAGESIGCELCHGPGAAHVADPEANPLWTLETRHAPCFVQGVCERCHNEIRDPDFDLEAALGAVSH